MPWTSLPPSGCGTRPRPWICRTTGREHRVRALMTFRGPLGEQHPHTETVRRLLEVMDAGGGGVPLQPRPSVEPHYENDG
jgi:hypothetical protein